MNESTTTAPVACVHGSNLDALSAAADAAVRKGDYEAAVTMLEALRSSRPDDVRLLINLGGVLKELGRFDEARPVLARAVDLDHGRHAAWSNLGTVCMELQQYDDAIAAFARALRLKPNHLPALAGMGVTLRRRGLPQDALRFLDLAVAEAPTDPDTRTARALAYLSLSDYRRGFTEYEWRLHTRTFIAGLPRGPSWKGEPLAGRTLLLHGEGGLGDILQFCRFIPVLYGRDCQLILQVPPPLVRLMRQNFDLPVFSTDDVLPPYDLFCTLMSLPYASGASIEDVSASSNYLSADPDIVSEWRDQLARDDFARAGGNNVRQPRLRVGLVWSGGKRPWHLENRLMDERRSTTLSELAPLAGLGTEVSFYSLQLGRPGAEAADPPSGLRIIDHTSRIGDFADTAGLVSLLDLVIAVDTSTAHLAGALGRPVCLLSRYDQCWRWLPGRSDTPWYSRMTVYTQSAPFDWNGVVQRICADLVNVMSKT